MQINLILMYLNKFSFQYRCALNLMQFLTVWIFHNGL